MSRASTLSGFTTAIGQPTNLNVGVITAVTVSSANVLFDDNLTTKQLTAIGVGVTNLNVSGVSTLSALNVSGVSTFSDVSIADKIFHTGDTDTALRFPANDTFTVETGGDERLRITSDGKVGINATSPGGQLCVTDTSTYTVNIGPNGSDGALVSTLGGSASLALGTDSTERLRISSAGKVGIGTDNPGTNLDVFGGVRSTNDSENFQVYAGNGLTRGLLQVSPSSNGLDIKSTGNNFGYISASTISGGTLYERLRITSAGDVGIGSTVPTVSVDISEKNDAVALPVGTTAQRPSTAYGGYIRWNSTSSALEVYNGTNWVEIISDYFPSGSTTLG